jgi:hypothetical protein
MNTVPCKHCERKAMSDTRKISDIAEEIRANWANVYFGAEPYLDAMGALDTIQDSFFLDSGDSIVRYFLANASSWRGDVARRVKAELRGLI